MKQVKTITSTDIKNFKMLYKFLRHYVDHELNVVGLCKLIRIMTDVFEVIGERTANRMKDIMYDYPTEDFKVARFGGYFFPQGQKLPRQEYLTDLIEKLEKRLKRQKK